MFTPDRRYDGFLFLQQAGYEDHKCATKFGPAIRDYYLMHYVLRGKGYFKVDGITYELKANDIFLIIPGKETTYFTEDDDPYEYCWFGFNGSVAREAVTAMGFGEGNWVRSINPEMHLGDRMKSVCCNQTPDIKDYFRVYSVFYDVMSNLVSGGVEFDRREFGKDYAMLAAEFVEHNYSNPDLSVDMLSKALGLSRSQVFRIFKKNYSLSPHDYITNFRIEKACNMVKKTNKTVEEIAYLCGYRSGSTLIKVYRRINGTTPKNNRLMEEKIVQKIKNSANDKEKK